MIFYVLAVLHQNKSKLFPLQTERQNMLRVRAESSRSESIRDHPRQLLMTHCACMQILHLPSDLTSPPCICWTLQMSRWAPGPASTECLSNNLVTPGRLSRSRMCCSGPILPLVSLAPPPFNNVHRYTIRKLPCSYSSAFTSVYVPAFLVQRPNTVTLGIYKTL